MHALVDVINFNDKNQDLKEHVKIKIDASGRTWNLTEANDNQSIKYNSLVESQETNSFNESYFEALATGRNLAATNGIDAPLKTHNLDVFIFPALGFAFIPPSMPNSIQISIALICFPVFRSASFGPVVSGHHSSSQFISRECHSQVGRHPNRISPSWGSPWPLLHRNSVQRRGADSVGILV